MRSFVKSSLGLAFALASACSGPEEGAVRTSPSPTSGPGGSSRRAPSADAAALDLQAMLAPVPEYEGVGRNLFAFGAARGPMGPMVEAPSPPEIERTVEPPPVAPTPRPAPSPRARIDMKYAGFLEKTRSDGVKAKYAIFLDGNEILAGAEGEMVANRFTVVEIGLESVTVSASGSNVTQRIPLQSN